MAWPNIMQRRERVRLEIESTGAVTTKRRKEIAKEYGCSSTAVRIDEVELSVKKLARGSFYVSAAMRRRIYGRDGRVCQYCGDKTAKNYDIEHIVPVALGGVAQEYNLVVSCHKCNTTKRSKVWIPKNLNEITSQNPRWREIVIKLAKTTQGEVRG